jgi:DNA repair protein RecO (recombination protein O)
MITHYKTQAFVFKKRDTNEADRIFSVFTDDFGRLDIFAKAIRKNTSKLRSGIDALFMSDIEFIQGKNRKTLTDAIKIERFDNIVKDLGKFKIANRITEVLDNFIKGQEKDENIFNLINETFIKLNGSVLSHKLYNLIYYYFLWNLLSLLGYCPEVQKCNICRGTLNPYNTYFSDKLGGIICKKCLNHDISAQKINSDIVKILRLVFKKEWQVVSKLKIGETSQKLFKEISEKYYAYILSGHSFKTNIQINR